MIAGIRMGTAASKVATVAAVAAVVASGVASTPASGAPGRDRQVTVTTTPGTTTVREQQPTPVDPDLSVTGGAVERAVVRIRTGAAAGDRLLFTDTRAISGKTTGRRLVLTGTASARRYQRALRSVRFVHTGDDPAPARTVRFTVRPVSGPPVRASKRLRVTAVPDAPRITTTPAALVVRAGGGSATLDARLRVIDPDSAALRGAVVRGTDGVALAFTDRSGITGSVDPGTGDLTLRGTASVAAYQLALRTVTLTANASAAPGRRAVRIVAVDTSDRSGTATRQVQVAASAPATVARDDTASTTEGSDGVVIDVLANDTVPAGTTPRISSVTQPRGGTVSLEGAAVRYRPEGDYCSAGQATDSFTYTLATGQTATVRVTVACVDDAPRAVDDTATVTEDAPATAITVLVNDTDVDGGPKTITSATQPTNGAVVITGGGGGLTYKPDADYCNSQQNGTADTFTYTLSPGSTATVAVTVTCVDDRPVANPDIVTVVEDAGAGAIDVLANDTDPDGGPKSVASTTQPTNGAVVITGGGTGLTYQPDADYCNSQQNGSPDTFTYTLNGGSSTTVAVAVTCIDDVPVAVADTITVAEDSGDLTGLLVANDTDVDSGPKFVTGITAGGGANYEIDFAGSGISVAPKPDYCNTQPRGAADVFTYTLNGGSQATATVTVTCVEDAPVARPDVATVSEDAVATAIPVLINDSDADDPTGPQTIESVTEPANGTVEITGRGTGLTYQPSADYCNSQQNGSPDTFTYTLPGGSTATVAVTVTCVDDLPVAQDDVVTLTEDAPSTVLPIFANDTDVDLGPGAQADILSSPVSSDFSVTYYVQSRVNEVRYAPPANYCNTQSGGTPTTFTYRYGNGRIATVSVFVTCVDDAPSAVNDAVTLFEDSLDFASALTSNDTDVDGGPRYITEITGSNASSFTLTVIGNSSTLRPSADYCNTHKGGSPDILTYTLNGGATATAMVTVTCTPDAPRARDDNFVLGVNECGVFLAPGVLDNDVDPDSNQIPTVRVGNRPVPTRAGGAVLLRADGSFNYCAPMNFQGRDSFDYTIQSTNGLTARATANFDLV